jgi:hypothetical protein
MKIRIVNYLVILSLFAILSCKKETEKKDVVEPTTEELVNDVMNSADSISSELNESMSENECDKLLAEYEDFMNEYVEFMNEYKGNPTDESLLIDYQRLMTESIEWSTKISDCAKDPLFASKFSAIQIKIANNIAN